MTRDSKKTQVEYKKGKQFLYDCEAAKRKVAVEADDGGQAMAGREADGEQAAAGEEGQRRAKQRCGGSLDERGVAPADVRVVWIRSEGAEEINEKELDRLDPHEVLNLLNASIVERQGQDGGAAGTDAAEADEAEAEETEAEDPSE